MRIISLALRQRIFGSIHTTDTCTVWDGDPTDALIFRGKKHQVHEIAFHLFCKAPEEIDSEIYSCILDDLCIAPNHLRLWTKTNSLSFDWERMKIGLEDRKDILRLYVAGVSKRTLKQWYMLEAKELDDMLRITK